MQLPAHFDSWFILLTSTILNNLPEAFYNVPANILSKFLPKGCLNSLQ